MTLKVHCVTLRSVDYRDSDRILTLLTAEKGKLSAAAKGVRKANAKMKNLTEPFTFSEVVLAEKNGRNTVTEAEIFDGFYPLRTDVVRYYAASCAVEFANAFLPEGLEASDFFLSLVGFLKSLAYGEGVCPKNALVSFLAEALEQSGYRLDPERCGRCGEPIRGEVFFSAQGGCNVCRSCKAEGDKKYSFETYSYLRGVCSGEITSEDGEKANNVLRFFNYYLQSVAGVSLRSIPILIDL
ncbi:MAG: DNA repair protein RecO [Candidatus Borkfalkiaceae bacterium]|nr:DNA repair protein RecO [Christensenellaceae bacterium]